MTGEKASDVSDAAGTLWLDVERREWSDDILAATGLTREQMPQAVEGTAQTGKLRADVAEAWGIDQCRSRGCGDNAAGAAGVGVVKDGDALLSLGTSGVIFAATKEFRPNPAGAVHAFCHCLPNMWHQMSVHLSAAACIDWVARLTARPVRPSCSPAPKASVRRAARKSSCPICRASGLRITMPRCAGRSWASTMTPRPSVWRRRCWRAWPSRWPTACRCCAMPGPSCRSCRSSAAGRVRPIGARRWPPR